MRPTLYKFFPLGEQDYYLERLNRLFQGLIYFSSPVQFNDPFEMSPLWAPPKREEIEQLDVNIGDETYLLSKSTINKIIRRVSEEMRARPGAAVSRDWLESIGVLCLTSKSDDLLMWSHYASSHTGVCIGFDSACPPFNTARQIGYNEERPSISTLALERCEDELVKNVLFSKSRHWQYEAEWRCIKRPVRTDELRYYQELSQSEPASVSEIANLLATQGGPGQYEFDPGAIRRIYLGARMEPKHRQKIIDLLKEHNVTARLFQMVLDPRYFRLNAEKVRP